MWRGTCGRGCQDKWLKTQGRMGAAQELGWTKDGWSCSPALNSGVPPRALSVPEHNDVIPQCLDHCCYCQQISLAELRRGGVMKRCPLSTLEGWSPAPRQASSQRQIHIFWLWSAPGFGRKFYSNFYVLVLARSSVFHLVGGWEWESSWVLHSHPLFIQLHPSCPHVSSQSNLSAITWAALCVILSGNTLRH